MTTIYQSKFSKDRRGIRSCIYSLTGNGQFGNVTINGYITSRLGEEKKLIVKKYLEMPDVYEVYKRNNNIYATYLNGQTKKIA